MRRSLGALFFLFLCGNLALGIVSVSISSDTYRELNSNHPLELTKEVTNQRLLDGLLTKLNLAPNSIPVSKIKTSVDYFHPGGNVNVNIGAALPEGRESLVAELMSKYLSLRADGFSRRLAGEIILKPLPHLDASPSERIIIAAYPQFEGAPFVTERQLTRMSPLLSRNKVEIRSGIIDDQFVYIFTLFRYPDGRMGRGVTFSRRDAKEFNRKLAAKFKAAQKYSESKGGEMDTQESNRLIQIYLQKSGIEWKTPEELNPR